LADIVVFGQTAADEYQCQEGRLAWKQWAARDMADAESRHESRIGQWGLMRCPETKMFGQGGEGAGQEDGKMAGWGVVQRT
jgi:hypothetical protein